MSFGIHAPSDDSIGNGLFVQIGHKGMQSFFDDLLIVQSTSQHGHFEFFVNRLVQCLQAGCDFGETAAIQEGLASLTGQYAIGAGDQWIDETIHLMQCLLLCSITHRLHTQVNCGQSTIYTMRVTSNFFQFICWKIEDFFFNLVKATITEVQRTTNEQILTFIQSLQ